jgi:hypothetical protein
MSKSYPGRRENISAGRIILFCFIWGKLSRLSGKVFDCGERNYGGFLVERESCGYIVFITGDSKRDLGSREENSSYLNRRQCNFSCHFYNKARSRL